MSDLVTGQTGDWEVVIGLEVHAQVTSRAKLFSGERVSKLMKGRSLEERVLEEGDYILIC